MELQRSFSHSQKPTTWPYLKPDQSSHCRPNSIPDEPSKYYPPSHAWVFQVVSLPQVSPQNPSIHLSWHPYVLHDHPISFFSSVTTPQEINKSELSMNIIMEVTQIHWYIAKHYKKLWILVSFIYDAARKNERNKERNNGKKEGNKYKWRKTIHTQ